MSTLCVPVSRANIAVGQWSALERDHWFGSLSPQLRSAILDRAEVRRLAPRSRLMIERAPQVAWYGIAAGAVKLTRMTEAGREICFDLLGPGCWFGDASLLRAGRSLCDATSCAETTALVLQANSFARVCEDYPEFMAALARLNATRVAEAAETHMADLTQPLQARLERQLQVLARRFGVALDACIEIDLPMSQQGLADLLGASRPRVNACLNRMAAAGRLKLGLRRITLFSN